MDQFRTSLLLRSRRSCIRRGRCRGRRVPGCLPLPAYSATLLIGALIPGFDAPSLALTSCFSLMSRGFGCRLRRRRWLRPGLSAASDLRYELGRIEEILLSVGEDFNDPDPTRWVPPRSIVAGAGAAGDLGAALRAAEDHPVRMVGPGSYELVPLLRVIAPQGAVDALGTAVAELGRCLLSRRRRGPGRCTGLVGVRACRWARWGTRPADLVARAAQAHAMLWSGPTGPAPPRCCRSPSPASPSPAGSGSRRLALTFALADQTLELGALLVSQPSHLHTLRHPPTIAPPHAQVVDFPTKRPIPVRALAIDAMRAKGRHIAPRGAGPHLPGAQRERQLLRLHHRRRRARARPTRAHRLPPPPGTDPL